MFHVSDTVAAIAVSPAGAARGILRVSGPRAIEIATVLFTPADGRAVDETRFASVAPGSLSIALANRGKSLLPCDAFVWPGGASYTRQPTVEFHTFGSSPLLEAALRTLCDNGARLAEPGEFTLRAFLAGRLDLTQAEAVLGVIDARGSDALQTALQQLAGGLTKPLTSLRVSLIDLLADLEAGLDFVEEDIEFISREDLMQRVTFAANEVRMLIERLARRGSSGAVPRVVLVGPPNSGKSSLFNALLDRFGMDSAEPALISDVPGTTRDYLAARLDLQGQQCELIDTAGVEEVLTADSIAAAAQEMTHDQGRQADFRLQCIDATRFDFIDTFCGEDLLTVYTKADLHSPSQEAGVVTSARTGAGLDALAEELRRRIRDLAAETHTGMVAATSARCEESLRAASDGLDRVHDLLHRAAGEELLAAEIREVLTHLGRVVGTVYTDDILDQIFQRFCIGK